MSFQISEPIESQRLFLTYRSRLENRWDPNYYRWMREFRTRVKCCPHPVESLKSSLSMVQYGISVRAIEEAIGVPMLRMANLQDDTWDVGELKYIELSAEEKKKYLLQPGDILFNRTNSKELVGKCCVFNLKGDYVFASYLIRVRVCETRLLPEYVTSFLSSNLGRLQIDAVSRQIAGMTNINAEEIRALFIPMLNVTGQRDVVSAWRSAIEKREATYAKARQLLASIDDLLLAELGIPRPLEPPNTLESRIFQRNFSELSGGRFDPIANQEKRRVMEEAIHHANCPVVPLRKLIHISKELVKEIEQGNTYIGLENIAGDTGDYVPTSEKDSISTAGQFYQNQILFPKLRPYLNKTHLATFDGLCSTEFHVFEAVGVSPEYLTHFLRSRAIVGITSLLMTGNTLPRLQLEDILKLPIPQPTHERQKKVCEKIAAIRAQVRSLRAQAQADLEQTKGDIEAMILGEPTKAA